MQSAGTKFVFQCSETAKDMLLKEGLDYKYGARHLKRAVERFLVYPLSNLVATGQIGLGDLVHVDVDGIKNRLVFSKSSGGALIHEMCRRARRRKHRANRCRVAWIADSGASKAAKKGQGRGERELRPGD